MLKVIIATIMILSMMGCATTKDWVATGGSRADGTIKLSYEYGSFESPQLNEQQAVETAKKRCKAWGYGNAEAFGGVVKNCQAPSSMGGCDQWLVTKEYQCLDKLSN